MSDALQRGTLGGDGRPSGAPGEDGARLFSELRSTLERAKELTRSLEARLHPPEEGSPARPGERAGELEKRLASAETDVKELAARLVESEHQSEQLMNLYVATYQLYLSLTPRDVQTAIAEIAINLLGAERFILLLIEEEGGGCEVALDEGFGGVPLEVPYADGVYRGGDALVDATLEDGVLRLGPTESSDALAVVPLRVQSSTVGALVILKLLDHKPILRPEDRDLLDLLSAHAASALFAAGLFAAKDRKLRTLESLVRLVRGD